MVETMSKLITYIALPADLPEHVRDTLKSISAEIRRARNPDEEGLAWSRYNAYENKLRCQFGKTVTREHASIYGTILP